MYIGIDPGNYGAIAVFTKKGKVIRIIDMPTQQKWTGKGIQVSAPGLLAELFNINIKKAYVERVHSMPKSGGVAAFTFGRGLGVIEGVLAALGIPVVFVTPSAWKKRAGLAGKTKGAAVTLALQRHPYAASKIGTSHDRAESILIADFGDQNG